MKKVTPTTIVNRNSGRYVLVLLVALIFGTTKLAAQLSDVHYLPPLKQHADNLSIIQQAYYLSTPEPATAAFDVMVYQGTNTTPIATLTNLSNTNGIEYALSNGDNNISLVTNTNTGVVLSNIVLAFIGGDGNVEYIHWDGLTLLSDTGFDYRAITFNDHRGNPDEPTVMGSGEVVLSSLVAGVSMTSNILVARSIIDQRNAAPGVDNDVKHFEVPRNNYSSNVLRTNMFLSTSRQDHYS